MYNKSIANFLGIPYALPPTGDLRFKSPQRWNRSWNVDYDATFDREQCVQRYKNLEVNGNEDCLYLNVFVPFEISGSPQEKRLPVLVMVHGGGYQTGSSNSKLFAPDYLLDHGVVLVTMNYRVSALGFFSTTNKVSPGNYGIKDVQMALVWIQENIDSFNGNPESVTLMGNSAGAGTTHLLALSKKTEGLFHRYILLSGAATAPWNNRPTTAYRQLCLELARRVGCLPQLNDIIVSNETTTEAYVEKFTIEDDEEMMKCMRRIDAREIIRTASTFHVWKYNPVCIFGPTIEDDSEDAVLTAEPIQLIKTGQFRDIPAIMQVVQDEGLLKTLVFYSDIDAEHEFLENLEEYLPLMLESEGKISNISIFIDSIEDFYFDGNITLNFNNNITELIGDGAITWPTYQCAQYQSKLGKSSVYFSLFAYEGTFSNTFRSGIPIRYGVDHTDDVNYLFPMFNYKYRDQMLHNTENDITMINVVTEMWANFAKEGIPKTWSIPAWPDYRDHHQFMRFGNDTSPEIVVQSDFLSDRMEFWDKLMANMSTESMEYGSFNFNPPENAASVNVVGCELIINLLSLIILFCFAYK